jgi:serine/threonine protein kinase
VISNLLQSLSYFLILGTASLFMDGLSAQLREPQVQAHVSISALSLAAVTAINVWGGHLLWAFRRRALGSGWLAQYRLQREIGRGGMGVVWAAYHTGLRREVAVKLLRSDQFDAALTHRRFEREVAVVSQLVSPHTVRILDYGVDEQQRLYYAMELLEGRNVAEAVATTGPFSPSRVIQIGTQFAASLGEAHAKGIVHRDVKPENVFLARNGSDRDYVKLLDFGLARLVEGEGTRLTRAGAIVGTPQYFPPEIGYGEQADARSDVYSAGATLYYMLTGRPPFQADSAIALLLAHANTPVVPPSQLLLEPVPAELEAVVLRCLAKDPGQRFADGTELGRALVACAVPSQESASPVQRPA